MANKFVAPPFWPLGFFVANLLFAAIAIASIAILAHDQRLAVHAAELQQQNFAKYRYDFDKATHVKIRLLEIIARKLEIPENDIQNTVNPAVVELAQP